MGQYADPSGNDPLWAYIKKLEARIKSLESSAPLRSASISDGGQLVLKGRTGQTLAIFGRLDDASLNAPDGHPQMGLRVFRATGEAAIEILDPQPAVDGFHQFVAIRDRQGNIIASDDTTSGQGLANPLIPIPFGDYSYPTATTTLSTFDPLAHASFFKQMPRVYVFFLVRASDGSTAGEVRLWNITRNEQVGTTTTVSAGSYAITYIGPAPVNGAHGDFTELQLQARRTAGSGTIGVRVVGATGIGS